MAELPPIGPVGQSMSPLPSLPRNPEMDRQGPPPSTTMAGWALGLAIAPFPLAWIVSVILAIQVIGRSKYSPGHGKGMAIAALIIVPLWIIATIGLFALSELTSADRDDTGTVTEAGRVDATKVQVGDCVKDDDLVGETNYSINVIPCTDAHLFEAYANFDLPSGSYPGDDVVSSQAEDGCTKRFQSYIGTSYDESDLDVTFLYPIKSSWRIDKGVTCLVTDGTTKGSLKDAKR
ncbi:MAG: septum formation family protein [Aeromicrobium sp.]